jgi:hypothetical protein
MSLRGCALTPTEGKRDKRVGGLAEEAGTVVVTADDKLLAALGDTPYAHLGHLLTGAGNLIPGAS